MIAELHAAALVPQSAYAVDFVAGAENIAVLQLKALRGVLCLSGRRDFGGADGIYRISCASRIYRAYGIC